MSNKHMIAAMVVTPILAILGWFAVDLVVKEKAQPAQAGSSYPLVAKSNCRYTSGKCSLENNELKAEITVVEDADLKTLELNSSHPLQGAKIAFSTGAERESNEPLDMVASDSQARAWNIALPVAATESNQFRLVLKLNDAFYFAESSLVFANYDTGFKTPDN